MSETSLKHGTFVWNELITPNMEKATEFYSALFGWEPESFAIGEVDYTMFSANGRRVGGIMRTPKEVEGKAPAWGSYILVDDVDAAAKKVEELGGKITFPPSDIPEIGRFCALSDPDGAEICIISYERK